ncbi:hypothetical protein [Marinobacter fuscus]|uniref:hypothetical protein n=1 Tax=Marinobacter fuscus TaxID=2109942 RepID=UPI0010570ED8|nr:hypothetical protein [Marinobacter fuscus]
MRPQTGSRLVEVASLSVSSKGSTQPGKSVSGTASVQKNLEDIDYRPLLAQGKVSKSELELILSSFDDAQLQQFVLNNTHLTLDDLFGYQNPTKAVRTLVDRWLNNTGIFSGEGARLLFSARAASGTNRLNVQSKFLSLNKSLYAHYKVPDDYSKTFVYLKWTSTSDDALLILDKQPLTGTAPEMQQAWLRYTDGWPPGEYQVELISAEEGLSVLAAQAFEVIE